MALALLAALLYLLQMAGLHDADRSDATPARSSRCLPSRCGSCAPA
jgi:hypothetical protein